MPTDAVFHSRRFACIQVKKISGQKIKRLGIERRAEPIKMSDQWFSLIGTHPPKMDADPSDQRIDRVETDGLASLQLIKTEGDGYSEKQGTIAPSIRGTSHQE